MSRNTILPMRHLIYSILLLISLNISAQSIEGHVIDLRGSPINAATIFIEEINQGLISDGSGKFRISLPSGTYTLKCSYPEYSDKICHISLTDKEQLFLDFRMVKDSLSLVDKETALVPDLAYSIIQKCINKASELQTSIKYYRADCYVNTNLVPDNIPKFIDKVVYKLDKVHVSKFKDKIISQELFTTHEFRYPDIYKNEIYSSRGYIPKRFMERGAINILEGTIYSPRFYNAISPLNQENLSYYKFNYEGCYGMGDTKYHKIKFWSRVNDPELFNGYLYITDNTWSIKYAVLKNNSQGMKSVFTISYENLSGNNYLPITLYSSITFDFMKTTGHASFYSGLKYETIDVGINRTKDL